MIVFRFFVIQYILLKHGLDNIVMAHPLFRPFKWVRILMPWKWFKQQNIEPCNVRNALLELGPIFIKFGQILSTRKDMIPPDLARELESLQDDVPAFDGLKAKQIIEARLGCPIEDLFDDFDQIPLASASIAQVHTARLKTGESVVIKVLRPGVQKLIKRDVTLLKVIAKAIKQAFPSVAQFKPVEMVDEFEYTLMHEVDLVREASNASQLKRNFEHSPVLHVPKIYWDYTYSDVMVQERVHGVPISDFDALRAAGVDFKQLATMGVEIFFTQVFRDCFFHADMHPGNIFVDISNPENPRYIAVDFGIMGSLSPDDQKYLASNFLAFFQRDYRTVAMLHVESGWIPANTRIEAFEANIRAVSEPIFERPLHDISFGKCLMRLIQTARQFDMDIQPQLLLLQKTLLSIEGLGRQLYPQLDLWQTAKPFLERWMKTYMGPKALRQNLKQRLPFLMNKLPQIPDAIYDILKEQQMKANHGRQPKVVKNKHGFYQNLGIFLMISSATALGVHLTERYDTLTVASFYAGTLGLFLWVSSLVQKG